MVISVSDNKQRHEVKKQQLISQLKSLVAYADEPLSLQKMTSNLFRHRRCSYRYQLDVQSFNNLLSVDPGRLIAEVEGMMTYEDLVKKTMAYGCLPAVVPELKTITVGGALSGIGIESSSYRYGLVHETVLEFDVLLADGRVITCSPDTEHVDLFYAFPNSYGTLGYALRVMIQLVPLKPYVQLRFEHFQSSDLFFTKLEDVLAENDAQGSIDFIDGVIFGLTHQVLITGTMVSEVPYISNYQYMKPYYRAVEQRTEDYLKVDDYIWRWDTDWFWCSGVFGMRNTILRFLLGKWILGSAHYMWIMRAAKKSRFIQAVYRHCFRAKEPVIQDVAIPINQAKTYLHFFASTIGILPIWICPVQQHASVDYPLFKMRPNQWYVNFGTWGMKVSNQGKGFYNRLIEQQVVALSGRKSLYSNSYYSKEEFWKIYDKSYYDSLKKRYDSHQTLGSLYEKCVEKLD